jgi:[protein-PII] uridylyltransferase
LAELFLKVEHILQEKDWKEKNIQEQVREKQNRLKSQAISLGWKHDLQSWLESLSFRYLLTHPVTTILEHLCLERKLDQVGPQVVFRHLREEIWEMTLVCFDTDRLFDDLTGVLWANGLNVLSADITTRSSGKVVDILQLDQLPDPLHPDALWKRVTDDLLALLEKRETLEKVLEKRDPRPLVSFTKPPSLPQDRIVIDEEASDFYTVIEVYTSERPGVLHMISKVLHEYGLSIQFAKISTPGAQALDVFYVTTKEGDKIRNKNLEHNLTNSLLETLAVHL